MKRLLQFFHVHVWRKTVQNGYGITVEQKCRCGAYRWHGLNHFRFHGEPDWQPGRHPHYNDDRRQLLNVSLYHTFLSCGSTHKEARGMVPEPEYLE